MDQIAAVRSFNRYYTRQLGVLDESYLDSGRSLGASRLLFEIGIDGARVSDLRRRLGLDSGYLSRLLRQLEADGLVAVARDPLDGRQRVAHLSPDGRREWRRLDRRSDRLTAGLIESLSDRQRSELVAALDRARRLLVAATVSFDVVDPGSPRARAVVGRYFAELDERFHAGFDQHLGGAGSDLDAFRPPHGSFVLMCADTDADDHTPIGCGAVQHVDASTGEIKRMWVDPDWRGLGLGRRLLASLEGIASDLGHERVVLDTNETLAEAIAMYTRSGYRAIPRYNDNPYAQRWFAKRLEPDRGRP